MINLQDRDDLPAGLQALFKDEARADEDRCDSGKSTCVRRWITHRGVPGMDLWRFFLGVVKQALDIDFDRLRNLADEHRNLRQMLGHTDYMDEMEYQVQTLIDNVSLFSEDVQLELYAVVVRCEHERLNHHMADSLEGRGGLGAHADACTLAHGCEFALGRDAVSAARVAQGLYEART